MIQIVNGWHDCTYRNIHKKIVNVDTLDCMLRDAIRMSDLQFKHLYGVRAFRFRAPDNSMRIVSTFIEPKVTPSVLPRAPAHKNDPRKGDYIVFVSDQDELYYGRILWVNMSDDQCGVLLLKDREYESFDLSMLESTGDFGRSVRWKITL